MKFPPPGKEQQQQLVCHILLLLLWLLLGPHSLTSVRWLHARGGKKDIISSDIYVYVRIECARVYI